MATSGRSGDTSRDAARGGADPGARELTQAEFRDVIGHFASGVTVITAEADGNLFGTTASAVSSLSLDPPMVLICMNKTSSTGRAVSESRRFAVNILNEDQHLLAERFATKDPDKFSGAPVVTGPHGQPLLVDALATIECDVAEAVTGGTHTVFIANVRTATSQDGAPLTYFRGEFGRFELPRDHHVYEVLRARLLARELPVGRQLELTQLAEGLQVPIGALYYALGRLSAEGMLERTAGGGFLVPPVTQATLEAAVDACVAMELGAVDMTIGHVEPDGLARFRETMEATVEHVRPGHFIDVDTSIDANSRFHETLICFTGSEPLLTCYRSVALPGILARAFEPRVSSTPTDVGFGDDHRDIVDAFEAGDAAAARAAIVRHGQRIKDAYRYGVEASDEVT